MTIKIVESISNPIIKKALSLQLRKNRKKHQQFLLEGIRGIQDMVSESPGIDVIFYEKKIESLQSGENLLYSSEKAGIELIQVTDSVMKKMTDTENPQGAIAIVHKPVYDLEEVIRKSQNILLLDRIQDPGNMGTLIRSAEAAGFNAVMMTTGSTDPFSAKCIRAATGAVFHLPVFELQDTEKTWEKLREYQYQIIGAALERGVVYTSITYKSPMVLVIGNEAKGIQPELLEMMDGAVTIPMKGKTQSLNAAIAGSVLMFHVATTCPRDKSMV